LATNTSAADLRRARILDAITWRRWMLLLPLIGVALLIRWHYAPDPGYAGDLDHFARWVRLIESDGLLRFYDENLRFGAWDRVYPQLSTLYFDGVRIVYGGAPQARVALHIPSFVALLKLLPIVSELALIAAVYAWLIERPALRILIPSLLALYPGLVATSAWWGQYDAPYVLFVVLALIALNRDKVLIAWLAFGVAVLLKQPAIVLAPLLLVLTLRRYGWQAALKGIIASGALCAIVIAPFFLRSGLDALSPYLKSSGAFPYLTNNAFNLWYALASIHKTGLLQFMEYPDSAVLFGGVTYKAAGLLMFAVFVLLLMVVMWRHYEEKREFVWAAALYMGFFMLPTQVHERYLYPAAVLLLVGAAQDANLWPIASGVALTFTYNILAVLIPNHNRGGTFGAQWLAFPAAVLNAALFAATVWRTASYKPQVQRGENTLPDLVRGSHENISRGKLDSNPNYVAGFHME
jgi:hypothetical protein